MLDATAFRHRFPALQDTVHLASCSQGAMSDLLVTAMLEFQVTMRQQGAPWARWVTEVERARSLFASFIGATPAEIAVVPSASAAAYQVASTQTWSERPRIVTTDLEFPSVSHVWLAQRGRGATITEVPSSNGVADADGYAAALDDDCDLVSIPLVTYRNGSRLPVADVVTMAHDIGARVFVDAYQAAGVEPIDVRELDCDYLTSGSLKYLLGIPGIAFLYARADLADPLDPPSTGWFGRVDPFAFDTTRLDYPTEARRFESGTPSIPSAFGAVAGLTMLSLADPIAVRDHVATLSARLHETLSSAGERLFSPADPALRGPQVTLFDDAPDRLAAFLAERRIVTSPRGEALRLSLHYYNSTDDVDAVVESIGQYRRTHD